MRIVRWAAVFLLVAATGVFALSNAEVVELRFEPLPWTLSLPVSFAILAAGLAGFFLGVIVAWLSGGRSRRQARRGQRRIDELEGELARIGHQASARSVDADR